MGRRNPGLKNGGGGGTAGSPGGGRPSGNSWRGIRGGPHGPGDPGGRRQSPGAWGVRSTAGPIFGRGRSFGDPGGRTTSSRKQVDTGNDPGLPIESPALRAIYAHYDKIVTTVEATEKGVLVVQTSTDPQAVAALQQHAAEVTEFINDGMAAMHKAMMKNGE